MKNTIKLIVSILLLLSTTNCSESKIVHFESGIVANNSGKYNEAISHFKKAIEKDPKYAIAYAAMGNSNSLLGDYKRGIEFNMKAIKLDSMLALAYCNVGTYSYNLNDFVTCGEFYMKYLIMNANNDNDATAVSNVLHSIQYPVPPNILELEYCEKNNIQSIDEIYKKEEYLNYFRGLLWYEYMMAVDKALKEKQQGIVVRPYLKETTLMIMERLEKISKKTGSPEAIKTINDHKKKLF